VLIHSPLVVAVGGSVTLFDGLIDFHCAATLPHPIQNTSTFYRKSHPAAGAKYPAKTRYLP
jgi:hypothetical protein